MQNAICLVIDRLQAGFLGPYGNTWVQTPEWNRLASESLVFDQALCETPPFDALYRRLWNGGPSLPAMLRERGVRSVLMSDDPQLAQLPGSEAFDERIFLPLLETITLAESLEETELARFFAAATELLSEATEPTCWWLHSRGMAGPWDAPFDWRGQYADEEDPTPPDFFTPPDRELAEDYDPDELLGVVHAYAGQVSLLDSCLGAFLDTFKASPIASNTLLAVLGARGFPLGEHRRVGPCDESLYNETTHVPLLMRLPERLGAMNRSQALVQLGDVPATLLAWCGGVNADPACSNGLLPLVRGEQQSLRDYLVCHSQHDHALRTPVWYYREPLAQGDAGELFAKPDDRWEVNEVSDRMAEVAAAAREFLNSVESPGAEVRAVPAILMSEVE